MKYTRIILPVLLWIIAPLVAFASHTAGGGFEYKYLGDSNTAGGRYRIYEVTLYLYQDCARGDTYAMSADNPAFFTVYTNDGQLFKVDTNIYYDNSGSIDIPSGLETKCGTFYDLSVLCMQRKKFVKRYALPDNDNGYTIAYQRCCRTTIAQNILSAGDQGLTYYCELPNKDAQNSGARFKEYPPLAICLNKATTFDHSATDADGDSLSYELDVAYNGATENDIKPKICTPPPYNAVPYAPGYSAETPMGADAELQIDDITGILSVNPKKVGGYQVAILCHEWRNGVRGKHYQARIYMEGDELRANRQELQAKCGHR